MADNKVFRTAKALKEVLKWGTPPKPKPQTLAQSIWPHLKSEAKPPAKPGPKSK